MRAFERADRLALAGYEHTRRFPRHERFGLTAQLRRGAVSTPSNLVEGGARSSGAEDLHFLDVAFASAGRIEAGEVLAGILRTLRKVRLLLPRTYSLRSTACSGEGSPRVPGGNAGEPPSGRDPERLRRCDPRGASYHRP
ncbi:MAG: four helix bundle protein [Deltaproteobacteria bacterium]|nr:four helix bundle protein [Deltaproteobacteria bacterium]